MIVNELIRKMRSRMCGGNYRKYMIFFSICCIFFVTKNIFDNHGNSTRSEDNNYIQQPSSTALSEKAKPFIENISRNVHQKFAAVLSEKDENFLNNVQDQNLGAGYSLPLSGKLFKGDKIREFPRKGIKFAGKSAPELDSNDIDALEKHRSNYKYNCDKWAVVTTVFEPPTEAVRRLMYRNDWCVVVAGDKGKPSLENYKINTTIGERIVFLSEQDQIDMHLPFVDHLPWNHFGRKNIGYLYAISMGAKTIFDFDDDNMLKFWLKDSSPDPAMDIDNFDRNGGTYSSETVYTPKVDSNIESFNPYPILGAPSLPCWPRGMPLDLVLDESNIGKIDDEFRLYQEESLTNTKESNFAVLQSIADLQPDVDALYRLIRGTPFSFTRPEKIAAPSVQKALGAKTIKSRPVLKIPTNTMTPYNAQATIFFESGFWSLYLPITVAGRVTDIWRAYFAQALFKTIGVELGFLPRPIVMQDRNLHSYLGDLDGEIPLYERSGVLVSHLLNNYVKNKTTNATTFIEILEELWIDLYEREYIEKEDVINMQLWIETLIKIGYQFPQIKSTSNSHSIALKTSKIISTSVSDIIKVRSRISKIGHAINSVDRTNLVKDENDRCSFDKQIIFGSVDENDEIVKDVTGTLGHINQQVTQVTRPQRSSDKNSEVLRSSPSNMEKFDAFISTDPKSMRQGGITSKSLIFITANRYNLGICNVDEWKYLNKDIETLNNEATNKGHVINALSRYDVEYLKYYTGIQANLVPSYDEYYVNQGFYQPDQKRLAIISSNATHFQKKITNILAPEFSSVSFDGMKNGPSTKEVRKYLAAILFPNNVVSYSLTKLYELKIPIFVPSIRFFLNYHDVSDCSSSEKACSNLRTSQGFKKEHFGFSMSRISTSAKYCSTDQTIDKDIRSDLNALKSIHPYSPNVDMLEDAEAESYWLQFADFYEWPHIQYFDSYSHLKELLRKANFESIHAAMKQELVIRKDVVLNRWCNIVHQIYNAKLGHN